MARVLFAVPIGQDMGGIITSTEQYVLGIREAGHQCDPVAVVFTSRDAEYGQIPRGKFADDFRPGPGTGWLMHPTSGWRNERRVSLGCDEGIERFRKLAKTYDIVIWASMYGFRNPATEGSVAWTKAFKTPTTKHVFMIHDDHMPERYPWARALAKYAAAYVGVQPCSFDSLLGVAAPRAMVYTPLPPLPRKIAPYASRQAAYASIQVWKTWKRADALVAAAPGLKHPVFFGGDGIALRYMRSPDKCPPRWQGLWAGMEADGRHKYLGVLSEDERDKVLSSVRFLVDLSARNNSGQYNRIAQEAMAQGCVVIANPKFITGHGQDPVFLPKVHYLPVTDDEYGPDELIAMLNYTMESITPEQYAKIQRNARKAVERFDRKVLGEQLVLSASTPYETGKIDREALASFQEVFGGKPL